MSRKTLSGWLAVLLSALPCMAGAQSQDFDAVQIETRALGHGLYVLTGRGGNIGVSVGGDGVVLIDDQYAPLAPKIRAAVEKISREPIRFVLNTHWHGDHTGGNEALGEAGTLIVAHDNVRKRLKAGGFMQAFKREVPPATAKALPVVTFSQNLSFHLNGLELQAIHVGPAHTDGDALVVFNGANVVHLGDLYFNGSYPVIDWGSGGHIDGMIAAVDRVLKLVDARTAIIPGHGPLSDRQGLLAYRALLLDVSTRIKTLMAAGKSLEDIQAAKPTAAYDEKWGGGFMKPQPWVEMVYHGLVQNGGVQLSR